MDVQAAVAAAEAALAPVFGPSTRRFITRLVLQAAWPHLALPSTEEQAA